MVEGGGINQFAINLGHYLPTLATTLFNSNDFPLVSDILGHLVFIKRLSPVKNQYKIKMHF